MKEILALNASFDNYILFMNCCPIHLAYLGRRTYASLKERTGADKVPHGTPLSINVKCTVDFLILARLGVGLNRSK